MVRTLRRHIVVRVLVCLLLSWAAADLFVPEMCNGEAASASTGSPANEQDHDDCFCCCTHVERATPVTVLFADSAPVPVEPTLTERLAAGVPRSLYHPPLHS